MATKAASALRAALCASLCALARPAVSVATFANTAFAGAGAASSPADLSALAAPALSSVRVAATLAPAQADLLLLSVGPPSGGGSFCGWLLLWVDDHLLIDTQQRGLAAYVNYSYAASARPPALRIDWVNNAAVPCSASLSWRGNFTPPGVVPASALSPDVSPADAAAAALRARMAAPPWGWGTYAPSTFWSHVLLPNAIAVRATLVRPSSGEALGDVQVFPNADPAVVRVLGHGYDGSTYTESTVSAWKLAPACTTTLGSTIGADGNLMLLATSNGTGCADLALFVSFEFLWGRAGAVAAAGGGGAGTHVTASAPGFSAVEIFASNASVSVVNPPAHAPYFALALADGGAAAVSTGAPVAPAAAAAAIGAARAAHAAKRARFPGDLADAYDAQQTIVAANSLYTPYEGVVTPVSRGWARGGTGYVLFPWDNLFLAWMAGIEPEARDICYSNLIAVLQGRTQGGYPPNYHAATHDTNDRSEPQLGAQLTLEIYKRYGDAWLVEKLFATLLGWAEWVWTQRLGAGSAAGPLVVLGSDLVAGDDETGGNLYAAGLESGLDNGIAYMGLDADEDFDNSTKRIRQYDVGASALFVAECEALVELAAVANRSDVVPTLQARGAAVARAMDATMYNAAEGVYESTFYNLTWHKRRMPTALYPLLSAALPADRVLAMLPLLTSPLGFCVNQTYFGAGDVNSRVLVTFYNASGGDNALCLSDACIGDCVNERYVYVRQEGLAQLLAAPAPGTLPLNQWRLGVTGDHALTAGAAPPAPGYALVRREGFCFAEAAAGRVPITLWHSAARGDFQTCAGNPACLADVAGNGYAPLGTQCFGYNGTTVDQLPCRFGVPSAARADAAYFANNYWRGRVWGPQVALVWLGLRRHDAVPAARAARQVLVAQALALELQNWRLSRQVMENINSVCGAGEDGGGWGANPFYTWGALLGHVALLEAGF